MADTDPTETHRSIGRELKKGSLELVVLSRLVRGEAYGYEIVSELSARTQGVFDITDSTLYPVLYRLERAGFVSIRWETQNRGVPRKYYQITPKGLTELAALRAEWSRYVGAIQQLLTSGD
ncbi:MAG: PadR family transcriptional regulator [Ahniella sp.]|nr:PadR family transcriptional regulator [Ahniella sp.]